MASAMMPAQEYWGTSKYSYPDLFAARDDAARTFEALAELDGEPYVSPYTSMREQIRRARSDPSPISDHALESWVSSFEEIGLMDKSDGHLRLTPAGMQLLDTVRTGKQRAAESPDKILTQYRRRAALVAARLLARYQLDNPGPKGASMGAAGYEGSDVFPFWVIWKVMRESDDRINKEEMKRIVLKVMRMADLPQAVENVKELREMRDQGSSDADIEAQIGSIVDYSEPDQLAQYWLRKAAAGGLLMDRAARADGYYHLQPEMKDILDDVLTEIPVVGYFENPSDWMAYYGAPVLWDGAAEEEPLPDDDPIWMEVQELVEKGERVIVLSGPPGTSKTWYARRLALGLVESDPNRFDFIQFHPSYSYEDFVEGYVPILAQDQLPSFQVRPKILLDMCRKAAEDPGSLYVLVIDELTRADVSRVFGEFLTYLEYRGRPVRLPYSDKHVTIPENLLVIATVNPFDRSAGGLDVALIRRFSQIRMWPDDRLLENILQKTPMSDELRAQVKGVFNQIQNHFDLGHCFFIGAADEADLRRIWRNKLRPLFETHFMHEKEKFQQIEELYPWKD